MNVELLDSIIEEGILAIEIGLFKLFPREYAMYLLGVIGQVYRPEIDAAFRKYSVMYTGNNEESN